MKIPKGTDIFPTCMNWEFALNNGVILYLKET